MDILISFLTTLIGIGIAAVGLDNQSARKIPVFRNAHPEESFTPKEIGKPERVLLLCIITLLCFVSTMRIYDKVENPLGIAKMLICLICLIGAASFDYREHRIPNIFPATIVISATILLGTGMLLRQAGAVAYITTGAVTSLACGLVLIAAAAITKQGIGAGDIKLICAMALMTGTYAVMGTLFFGVILCSIYAIIAMVLKKKSVNSTVPFGPFLFLGYVTTLFAVNF